MTYCPQPGTFPARVIDYLRSLPTGAERSSAELADELDQHPASIPGLLAHARQRGAIGVRKEGRLIYWRLGNGEPEPRPHDFEPDEPLKTRRRQEIAPAPATPFHGAAGFRAGLWTDGTLEIRRGDGELMLLTRDEATLLRDLLRGGA